ncbi:hypothetical protein ACFL08_05390 [Patescibacteria group bacterium]
MAEENNTFNSLDEKDTIEQIESLKTTIQEAEKTIREARSILIKLQGDDVESGDSGSIVQGDFDGQIMIGDDGKQYPVPANYASKSKLVEGDRLKLTITPNGSFIYKQVGPVDRKTIIGIVSQDENENFYILADGKAYKILLASITYFKVSPGDEVVIVTSRDIDSSWAAIENVLRKGGSSTPAQNTTDSDFVHGIELIDTDSAEEDTPKESPTNESEKEESDDSLLDEWISDIEDIKEEMKKEKAQETI